MRLINSYVEWIKKVNAKKEEEKNLIIFISNSTNSFSFSRLFLLLIQKFFRAENWNFSWNCNWSVLLLPAALETFFKLRQYDFFCVLNKKKGFYFMFFLSCNWMDIKERTFTVKHHNEPHYMKVIIFRDEIWFHDILTIKHKKITLWTCSFSLGRTV